VQKWTKGPASPPGLQRARAGVHACARVSRPARTRARTRSGCERDANALARRGGDQDGRLPTARGGWLSGRRARVGEGGGTCKKMGPSLARWPASPAVARRRGAAGVPPRLEGRGVHRRGRSGRPHLGGHWPKWSASVKRSGAACRRGRRGSRRRRVSGRKGK
jgi:hypothetical protein